jgi:UDP-glucose 4-epimerase
MNYLITGGCGFLGTALIQKLLTNESNSIRVIDNLTTGSRNDLAKVTSYNEINSTEIKDQPQGVELIVGDILDEKLSLMVTQGCDVIVHFAANTGVGPSVQYPRLDCMNNVIGTFNYLEAARIQNIHRFILASSGAPIGNVKPPIHEELAPHPVSPYGASKLAGEGYCSAYFNTFGIDTVILRFGNVYGPGSLHKSSIVAKFIQQAINGETLEIYGDGTQTRDFIYIDDLINAVQLAISSPSIGGEAFQIATNMETTIGELAEELVKIIRSEGIQDIKIINGDNRLGDVMRNYSDTTKAKVKLGWKPKVKLKEGLIKTVRYFMKVNKLL